MLALPARLAAQAAPDAQPAPTVTQVAVGAYANASSEDEGTWRGWTADLLVLPSESGSCHLSAAGFDRPEGRGTLFSAGKTFFLGTASSLYLGARAGTQDAYLPIVGGDLDLRLGLPGGWKWDLGGTLNRYAGGEATRIVRAGPAFEGQDWLVSVLWQARTDTPEAGQDNAGILDLRFGLSEVRRWHALRLAAGRGILDTLATAGGTGGLAGGGSGGVPGGMGARRGRTSTPGTTPATTAAGALPRGREWFTSLTGHWPITPRFALRAEGFWGEAPGTTTSGGSLQVVVTW